MKKGYEKLFTELDVVVELFVLEVRKKNLNNIAAGEWDVKDVLCHIVFWHNYYAQQYKSLAEGDEPYVFVGSAIRNKEGVKSLRYLSKKALEEELKKSQKSLRVSIVEKEVPKMMYTVRHEYTTKEFLEIVIGHIKRHTIQVRRAKEV